MKILYKINSFLVSMVFTGTALAHDGHDHNHWSSDSLHMLFYASLVSVVSFGAVVLVKTIKNNAAKEGKE
jgi:hypothetical protein